MPRPTASASRSAAALPASLSHPLRTVLDRPTRRCDMAKERVTAKYKTLHDLPGPDRARAREVLAWAFSHGRSVDRTALATILLAQRACASERGDPFDRWTLDQLADFMWSDLTEWC